jgi:hypothetical protein
MFVYVCICMQYTASLVWESLLPRYFCIHMFVYVCTCIYADVIDGNLVQSITYIHTHNTHIHIHTHTHTNTHSFIRSHIHRGTYHYCTSIHTHVHTYTCVQIHVQCIRAGIYRCVCMYICMYVCDVVHQGRKCTRIHMYAHIKCILAATNCWAEIREAARYTLHTQLYTHTHVYSHQVHSGSNKLFGRNL